MPPQYRSFLHAALALIAVFGFVWGGYSYAHGKRVTPESLREDFQKSDLGKLPASERQSVIGSIAAKVSQLESNFARREAQSDGTWLRFFEQLSDEEKSKFIEATLPMGLKQLLDSFEKLPPEMRQKALRNAMKRLRETFVPNPKEVLVSNGTNTMSIPKPLISASLQDKIVSMGLASLWKDGSPQTRAELAPLLEEIQRSMQNGQLIHQPQQPR